MCIQMIGIDHTKAGLDVRSVFSFTKKKSIEAMEQLTNQDGIYGAIVLSTCNRMELWLSTTKDWNGDSYSLLCSLKQVEKDMFAHCFVKRYDQDAVDHLFQVAAGMESQILGEEQIITQVREALETARECDGVDGVLEVLFRMAITAGKQVKTEVVFPAGQISVINRALAELEEQGNVLENRNCMVIGNGEMGRRSAKALLKAGARVWVTVRRYHHGQVEVPEGCQQVDYDQREELLGDMDYIVSATRSPHYTLTKAMLERHPGTGRQVCMDLAVPRDMEPDIRELPDRILYDIDDFPTDQKDEALLSAKRQAEKIIQEQEEEFYGWLQGREVLPLIRLVKAAAAEDLTLRLKKKINRFQGTEDEKEKLTESIDQSAQKVINKMLFGMKEQLDEGTFKRCMEGLGRVYGE